jgi:hypothetical protein
MPFYPTPDREDGCDITDFYGVDARLGWATFMRNHDELTLDKQSEDERAEVFAAFGPDPDMRIYGRA